MFGIKILFDALGVSEAQQAELRALLDPTKVKAALAEVAAWKRDMEKLIRETHEAMADLQSRFDQLEHDVFQARQAAQGGTVQTPQQERALDAVLLQAAAEGKITYTIHDTPAEAANYVNGHDSGNAAGSDPGSEPGSSSGSGASDSGSVG